MFRYAVNEPWPHKPMSEGLTILLDPGDEGLDTMLVAGVDGPSRHEVKALTKEPIRLGIRPLSPIVWIVLAGQRISFDAPYALGIHSADRVAAIRHSAGHVSNWTPATRGLLTIVTIDTTTNLIRGVRAVSLSQAWWSALAVALEAVPAAITSRQQYAAIQAVYAGSTTPKDMLKACSIVETAGKV